jgi:hypothetical protein
MALRFDPDGNQVLAEWLESCGPSREDRDLVSEVLRAVASGESLHWYMVSDPSDDTVTIIEPREGLTVHIRLYADEPDQFELVRILYMTTISPNDLEARDR